MVKIAAVQACLSLLTEGINLAYEKHLHAEVEFIKMSTSMLVMGISIPSAQSSVGMKSRSTGQQNGCFS